MPKINLKTVAYSTIRRKIVTCEYAPGSFLNEEILTGELKLSRTPIRDALSRLEQEGLIEIKPKKGIMVMPLSTDTINMIFEVRMLYEPYILLNYGPLIPTDSLKEFYHIFQHKDVKSECALNNDYVYDLDSAFHSLIINACPNIYLQQNYNQIQTQDARFRYMTGDVDSCRLEDTFKEHLNIVCSCLQNDWKKAAEKMNFHLEQSKQASFSLIFNEMGLQSIYL